MTIRTYGDVRVVIEGCDRVRWAGRVPEQQVAGVWPEDGERDELLQLLAADRPLLVVFPLGPPSLTVLAEELDPSLPSSLGGGRDTDVLELHVPVLDWAPEPMRRRGEQFAATAAAAARSTPPCVLPPLLFDRPSPGTRRVRFAQQTAACRRLSEDMLRSAAGHAFAHGRSAGRAGSDARVVA